MIYYFNGSLRLKNKYLYHSKNRGKKFRQILKLFTLNLTASQFVPRRGHSKQGRSTSKKTIVFGLFQLNGKGLYRSSF